MRTKKFDVSMNDGACDCFAAYPEEGRAYPGVLLLMDGYGPRGYLYEMTERLASHGYYVLLPNLFYRVRRAPVIDMPFPVTKETLPQARQQLMALFTQYDAAKGVRDVGSLLDFMAAQKEVLPGKFGLTGYCMGGGLALRAAAAYPDRVAAVASFHAGRLATDAPDSPHRLSDRIRARVYIAHADKDESMPAEQIERLREAFNAAGVHYEAELYEGAMHGFTMADLPAYNAAALKRHWDHLLPLFASELKP